MLDEALRRRIAARREIVDNIRSALIEQLRASYPR